MATLHMLDYIESACLSSQCHVVDRGHKHTNGVCESCFYLRRPPPCNDVIQDVGSYDEEDTFISSQHADVQKQWCEPQLEHAGDKACISSSSSLGDQAATNAATNTEQAILSNCGYTDLEVGESRGVTAALTSAALQAHADTQHVESESSDGFSEEGNEIYQGENVLFLLSKRRPENTMLAELWPLVVESLEYRARSELKDIKQAILVAYASPAQQCLTLLQQRIDELTYHIS
jgi:hypothetical protein